MTNALVTVLGLSPAVITETLWALAHRKSDGRPDPLVVDEIHVLTTARGIEQVRTRLEGPDGGLARVCAELGWQDRRPSLTVAPIRSADGRVLDDIRGEADNSALGDATVRLVGRLSERDEMCVHASMAGGRKTMSFFMGYVLSLFGRPGDELSHVLLHDERFEYCRDFWCPTRAPTPLSYLDHTTKQTVELDARDARVDLTPIPFVRLRDYIPRKDWLRLIDRGFTELVKAVDATLRPPRLICRDASREIVAGPYRFQLPYREYLMYRMVASARARSSSSADGDQYAGWLSASDFDSRDRPCVQQFLALYEELFPERYDQYQDFCQRLIAAERTPELAQRRASVMNLFSEIRSKLNDEIEEHLPDRTLASRFTLDRVRGRGGRPNRFGLTLRPEQIEIIER